METTGINKTVYRSDVISALDSFTSVRNVLAWEMFQDGQVRNYDGVINDLQRLYPNIDFDSVTENINPESIAADENAIYALVDNIINKLIESGIPKDNFNYAIWACDDPDNVADTYGVDIDDVSAYKITDGILLQDLGYEGQLYGVAEYPEEEWDVIESALKGGNMKTMGENMKELHLDKELTEQELNSHWYEIEDPIVDENDIIFNMPCDDWFTVFSGMFKSVEEFQNWLNDNGNGMESNLAYSSDDKSIIMCFGFFDENNNYTYSYVNIKGSAYDYLLGKCNEVCQDELDMNMEEVIQDDKIEVMNNRQIKSGYERNADSIRKIFSSVTESDVEKYTLDDFSFGFWGAPDIKSDEELSRKFDVELDTGDYIAAYLSAKENGVDISSKNEEFFQECLEYAKPENNWYLKIHDEYIKHYYEKATHGDIDGKSLFDLKEKLNNLKQELDSTEPWKENKIIRLQYNIDEKEAEIKGYQEYFGNKQDTSHNRYHDDYADLYWQGKAPEHYNRYMAKLKAEHPGSF